jgi:hypothetical protein|tara:strand:+ start:344 stop:619 length:276 start_codon:yes stop_codon:yes gene_type:complete
LKTQQPFQIKNSNLSDHPTYETLINTPNEQTATYRYDLLGRFAKKMSYFDDELIMELKPQNIVFDIPPTNDHASIVREPNENIPFSGSKIA